MTESYVYQALRTPFGKYGGALATVRPDDLAATVISEIVTRAEQLDPAEVDEVIFGNANGAGEENRNLARMAWLLADLPVSVPASTVNRLCGSSLDAVMSASRQISTGDAEIVLAGGAESMSRAPWVLPKNTQAFPAGDVQLSSTTLGWRLVNPRMSPQWTVSLGEATEQLAAKYGISRQDQDEFALRSHRLAAEAWEAGFYRDQIVSVPGNELQIDESIRANSSLAALSGLPTVFRSGADAGTVTAGNASPLSDGASAVLLGSERAAKKLGEPLLRIAGRAAAANEPQFFGAAPIEAAERALRRAGISWAEVDAVELNEAFAAQALTCIRAWDVDPELVNQRGGAVALGHPLGASGARLIGTLAASLRASGGRWGVAAICIGVGQALAVVVENVSSSELRKLPEVKGAN